MQYQQLGYIYVVRLESGEEFTETLKAFLTEKGIESGGIKAIGAVSRAELAYWNAETREYESWEFNEQMEVVSLLGNCSLREGKPFPHIHCVLSKRDFTVIAGHLNRAHIHPTLEIWIEPGERPIVRAREEASGLYLLNLEQKVR
jgi:predicted DNA-binding protein with PD1-like motif